MSKIFFYWGTNEWLKMYSMLVQKNSVTAMYKVCIAVNCKKSLQIPKVYSEAANRRRTDN